MPVWRLALVAEDASTALDGMPIMHIPSSCCSLGMTRGGVLLLGRTHPRGVCLPTDQAPAMLTEAEA